MFFAPWVRSIVALKKPTAQDACPGGSLGQHAVSRKSHSVDLRCFKKWKGRNIAKQMLRYPLRLCDREWPADANAPTSKQESQGWKGEPGGTVARGATGLAPPPQGHPRVGRACQAAVDALSQSTVGL